MLLIAALIASAPVDCLTRTRYLMGTMLEVEACGAPGSLAAATHAAFERVAQLEDALSHFRADSELSRLHEADGWRPVSDDLFSALRSAEAWRTRTSGRFDAAYRSPAGTPRPQLDAARRKVRLAPGARLDFGGIGKGIALDAAAGALRRKGIAGGRLNFGGHILFLGERAEAVVAHPVSGEPFLRLSGVRGSVSTSGNAEQPLHIVDPHSRRPVAAGASVTVVADDATSADALSTALFVMGPVAGLAWAENEGVAALYLIGEAPEVRATSAMSRFAAQDTLVRSIP